ncbi:MAG: hypothetical protein U1G07_27155 [Verrucomicrobiota bacterium]
MSEAAKFVEFLESHQPPLKAGDYRITVTQTLSHAPKAITASWGGKPYQFTVAGPQFSLAPDEIATVFPPAGSLGDHSNVFPHLALQRSTLPWERSGGSPSTPWLALLVYDEDDLAQGLIRPAAPPLGTQALTVKNLAARDASYPLRHEPSQADTAVSAVDLKTSALSTFLPTEKECQLLCHVRRNILFSIPWGNGRGGALDGLLARLPIEGAISTESISIEPTGEPHCWRLLIPERQRSFLLWENTSENTLQVSDEQAAEYAFVIGNRLPRAGKDTTVHLVSVEGRFGPSATSTRKGRVREYTRFVSLYQWRFSCLSHEHTFNGLLLRLNPSLSGGGSPHATLRLPGTGQPPAETHLAAGFTLLPHRFRDGSQSFSWYRGPLAPGPTRLEPLPLPATSADALLSFAKRSGLFYTGYASAWELGRLLCLANRRVAQALYQWKRARARTGRQTDPIVQDKLQRLPIKLPPASATDPGDDLPDAVTDWIKSLRRLDPVPFRYLVPDERMLPVESIRFFEIDPHWINCLIDGAFSIGRILENDHARDQILYREQSAALGHDLHPDNRITGFLLRSAAVSGWPRLNVAGLSQIAGQPDMAHKQLRLDRLAPDILLCLFQGAPARYEIYLPRESIHFGVPTGTDGSQETTLFEGVVLRMGRLRLDATSTSPPDPVNFALNLVRGVPKVVFGS